MEVENEYVMRTATKKPNGIARRHVGVRLKTATLAWILYLAV
jgi:hypothetical protein